MGFFSGLFGKRKRTLKDLTVDDLKREQISLGSEQQKIDQEANRLDKDEAQLKSEYAEAASAIQKRGIARRIAGHRALAAAAWRPAVRTVTRCSVRSTVSW